MILNSPFFFLFYFVWTRFGLFYSRLAFKWWNVGTFWLIQCEKKVNSDSIVPNLNGTRFRSLQFWLVQREKKSMLVNLLFFNCSSADGLRQIWLFASGPSKAAVFDQFNLEASAFRLIRHDIYFVSNMMEISSFVWVALVITLTCWREYSSCGILHSNNGSSLLMPTIADRLVADCMPRWIEIGEGRWCVYWPIDICCLAVHHLHVNWSIDGSNVCHCLYKVGTLVCCVTSR